jgi:predicted peroxiredoxin
VQPCAKKRGIAQEDLIDGATIVGGASLVALLAAGAASLSF